MERIRIISILDEQISQWMQKVEIKKSKIHDSESFEEAYCNYIDYFDVIFYFSNFCNKLSNFLSGDVKPSFYNTFKKTGIDNSLFLLLGFSEKESENLETKEFSWEELSLEIYPNLNKAIVMYEETINNLEKEQEIVILKGQKIIDEIIFSIEELTKQIKNKLEAVPPPVIEDFRYILHERAGLISMYLWYEKRQYVPDKVNYLEGRIQRRTQRGTRRKIQEDPRKTHLNIWNKQYSNFQNLIELNVVNDYYKQRFKQVNQDFAEYSSKILQYSIVIENSHKILENLKEMNPEFPLFLPRLAELAEMDKEDTEESLIHVLKKHPKIGKYDKMSQVLVFSKPDEISNLIDKLLKQYEQTSVKEE
ncbi:hypothetical protein ES705_49190 [subsurface metagenome]